MRINEHDKRCEGIVKSLEKITSGNYAYYYGELVEIQFDDDNAEYFVIDDEIYSYYDGLTIAGKKHTEEEINELDEALGAADIGDFFSDWYNIDYIVDYKKEYQHARIMVACGGPTIFVNTWDKCVELYWWNESGKAWLSNEICDAIDDYFSEVYRWS